MARNIKRILVPPRLVRVSLERDKPTKAIMKPSGLLAGRENVPKGSSDRTGVMRMVSNFDVDGKKGIGERDLRKGQIIGRTSTSIKPKRIEITRHWRKGRPVKGHTREL